MGISYVLVGQTRKFYLSPGVTARLDTISSCLRNHSTTFCWFVRLNRPGLPGHRVFRVSEKYRDGCLKEHDFNCCVLQLITARLDTISSYLRNHSTTLCWFVRLSCLGLPGHGVFRVSEMYRDGVWNLTR